MALGISLCDQCAVCGSVFRPCLCTPEGKQRAAARMPAHAPPSFALPDAVPGLSAPLAEPLAFITYLVGADGQRVAVNEERDGAAALRLARRVSKMLTGRLVVQEGGQILAAFQRGQDVTAAARLVQVAPGLIVGTVDYAEAVRQFCELMGGAPAVLQVLGGSRQPMQPPLDPDAPLALTLGPDEELEVTEQPITLRQEE